MTEIVEIPFRRIRGTKEWQAEQEKLRAAWEVIEGKMREMGIAPITIDNRQLTIEDLQARRPAVVAKGLRLMRLMQMLQEHGQVSRVMCQERRADGRKCRYPVEEGQAMCLAHAEWRAGPLAAHPFPDDALGLQRLMAKLLSGLLYGKMDPQRARVAADLCRTMRQNLEGCERAAREAEEEFFL